MEGGKRLMRVAMAIVMLSMLLVGNAVDVAQDEISPASDSGPQHGHVHGLRQRHHHWKKKCLGKCLFKCSKIIIQPPQFTACMGLCMLGCMLSPPPAVYTCTYDCTHSNIIKSNTTDVVQVSSLVNTCYKGCSIAKV